MIDSQPRKGGEDMPTFVIFSKVSPDKGVKNLKQRNAAVQQALKTKCPMVGFRDSYALDRGYELLDIAEAASLEDAQRAAKVIEEVEGATTEVVAAFPWREFVATRSRAA
jgi:uncharacterized protein with GYD domain